MQTYLNFKLKPALYYSTLVIKVFKLIIHYCVNFKKMKAVDRGD